MIAPAARIPEQPAVNMVLCQLRTNGILDERILSALVTYPREYFVPAAMQGSAYADDDIPIGGNRYLIAPLTFARMLSLADIKAEERVLIIGGGMGFSAAAISLLCRDVVMCETDDALVKHARSALTKSGVNNVQVEQVPGLAGGCAGKGPYDLILIEGSVERLPAELCGQLKAEGRLITVLHTPGGTNLTQGHGRLIRATSVEGTWLVQREREEFLPLLPGFETPPRFMF